MSVINVQNPAALAIPEFHSLIEEAFAGDQFPSIAVMEGEIRNLILDPLAAVLVKPYTALAILTLPRGAFIDNPQAIHFYNRGSKDDAKEVKKATVDFLHSHGYNRILALNFSGHPDEAWLKVVTPEGWKATKKASLYELGST